jgi:DNA adenine methylase
MKRVEGLLFSYPGSKWRLAKRFQRYYPRHQVYADVFGGSAALIARQAPTAAEVYNDLDADVHNVFAAVKDAAQCNEVLRLLQSTVNDRHQYKMCKRILADPSESSARRAWAFLVAGNIGFAAHPALANGWTAHERQRRDLLALPGKLAWWHERLRNVRLESRPWQEIVDRYDAPGTFFLADPPYLAGVLRGSASEYYQHRMSAEAHVELIERLRRIQGHAMICGYNHPLYTRLLFHWRRVQFDARETMGGKAGRRKEIVWLSYADDGSRLETNRLRIAQRYVQIMETEEEAARYLERVKRLRRLLK